jgi:hypothetical protein
VRDMKVEVRRRGGPPSNPRSGHSGESSAAR